MQRRKYEEEYKTMKRKLRKIEEKDEGNQGADKESDESSCKWTEAISPK